MVFLLGVPVSVDTTDTLSLGLLTGPLRPMSLR